MFDDYYIIPKDIDEWTDEKLQLAICNKVVTEVYDIGSHSNFDLCKFINTIHPLIFEYIHRQIQYNKHGKK